jgi:hypothetical protein
MLYVRDIQLSDGFSKIETLHPLPVIGRIKGIGIQPYFVIGGVKTFGGFDNDSGTFALVDQNGATLFEAKPDDCAFYSNTKLRELVKPVDIEVKSGTLVKVLQQEPSAFMLQYPQYVKLYIEY